MTLSVKCMDHLDQLLQENFELKKQIAYEKKRYLDLMNGFMELRNSIRDQEKEKIISTDIQDLVKERQQLQSTLQSLSQEVEFLSTKNEEFLRELKMKDFYLSYKQCVDELNTLREAHSVLISMIQNQHVNIGASNYFSNEKSSKRRSMDYVQKIRQNSKDFRISKTPGSGSRSNLRCSTDRKNIDSTFKNMKMLPIQHQIYDKNRMRTSSLQSFFSCSGNKESIDPQSSETPDEIDMAILNNHYLRMIKDPEFLEKNDVNFLRH